MNKPFDLKAAKRGEPILCDRKPAEFIAHLPENDPDHRVVVSCNGRICAFREDGRAFVSTSAELTMAPRAVKTMGYRSYYAWWLGKVSRTCLIDTAPCTPESVERQKGFIRWIHTEWQYDEVEL